jgi:hypothetical protein
MVKINGSEKSMFKLVLKVSTISTKISITYLQVAAQFSYSYFINVVVFADLPKFLAIVISDTVIQSVPQELQCTGLDRKMGDF